MSVRSAGARRSVSKVTVALATTTSPPGPRVRRIVNDSWPMRSAGTGASTSDREGALVHRGNLGGGKARQRERERDDQRECAHVRNMIPAAQGRVHSSSAGVRKIRSLMRCRMRSYIARPFSAVASDGRPMDPALSFGTRSMSATVTPQLLASHHVILRPFHAHELRREIQHERRVGLVAVHVLRLSLEQIAERNRVEVDHAHARLARDHGARAHPGADRDRAR